ncbi:uncharacterized protein LOC116503301 [Thamnophis elegans]|uniref:uncharacterized protein LOC116503301 n=1 Tax=Thamnophis elegans TaxID=35005 RepID=UPI001378392A|nr:uncharacterized protein LOC116503301 [Thamnophis elegans]XP_032065512.1 uncharacterized protein LOC116503301 [Thamnophis elegans]XP_032065514.1 uncharacterized protein LOC116503301 [Thamnophis elegans]XP_032065515.1 uncharacterized protein LOC116503301 [Thamnophis elegans]
MALQPKSALAAQAVMNISKAEEVRKETELIMKPHANWEEYLMPGPISIAILGELACIAAREGDFAINLAPPQGGYKYIRYPDSFQASLMQVSNSGWHAFSTAHKNMDGIRLLSMSVPEQIKMVIKTLFQDDLTLIDALLPGQLSSLKSIADECSSLAKAVDNKFHDVMSLIEELLEVCTSSKSQYEKGLAETRRALEDLRLRKEAAEDAKVKAEEYYKEIKNKVTETFDDYRKAIDSIPTGWNAAILEFTSTIRETLTVPIATLTSFLSFKENMLPSPIHFRSEEDCGSEDDFIAMNNICALSPRMLPLVNALKTVVDDEGNIDMDLLYNKKHNEITAIWTKNKSQQLLEKIKKERKCSMKKLAVKICNYIIEISNILIEVVESGNINKKKLLKKMDVLSDDIITFDSRSKSCHRTSPFGPMAPNMAKSQKKVQEESTSAVKNSVLKIEQTKEILKISQEEYQKSFDNFKQQNNDLLDVLNEMRNCEKKEIDFEKAKQMLIKGLDAMGRVKEQWEKMVRFFQMISNLMDSCLNKSLTDFVKSAENLPQIPNYSHRDFVVDMIYKQAFNASNIAHLVHMISDTYTEVSSKYLMDQVGSLSRLISMDPSDPKFQVERLKLADGCDSARQAIGDLVVKQKKEFENNIHARVAKINSELKAVLPEVPEAERKAIEHNVQKGMREITQDEADQFM